MSQLSDLMGKTKTEKTKKKRSSKKELDGSKYVDTTPELQEARGKDVAVISFGRMNPVTIGHEKLANAVISTAMKNNGVPLIYLSHSSDPKKNPLSYDQKIALAKSAFGTKLIVKSKARTILEVAAELENKFKELVVVVGEDRVKEFETLLNKYNGNLYNYDSIKVVSAGERDPDADDVTGMSASKMRALAKDGDMESFKKGLPKKLQSKAEKVYNMVRAGMGINESVEEVELEEALTRQQRLKRKMIMRRIMPKILAGRRRAMRRKATMSVIKKRAMKQVRVALKKKFSKGQNYADLPYSARQRIDDRIARIPQARLQILMRRFIPKIKQKEKERFLSKIAKANAQNVLQKTATTTPSSVQAVRKEEINLAFEKFLNENRFLKKTDRESLIESGIRLANELGGNTNYAIKEIEKLRKGLSRHYLVKEALEKANENFDEESYQQYTIEKRLKPQDPDVDHLPGSQPKGYYKGVAKDKKDDRARHFARKAKMDDDNPKAYTPAPGDKEAETKPSVHTNKFKKMFGEANYEKAMMKRPHMLLRNGEVVIDKRFKMYRKAKEVDAMMSDIQASCQTEEIEQVMEAIDFIFESNPTEALKKKAEKSGIPYGILKKVFDRGVAAWRTGHRPGTTPTQWGLARVNSFATKGKGTWGKADKDLAAKV